MTRSIFKRLPGARRFRSRATWATAVIALFGTLMIVSGAGAAATAVPLGTAGNFAVLAGAGISSVPTSGITGDVGVSPAAGSSITGLTCAEVTGTIYSVDATGPLPCRVTDPGLLTVAKSDLTAAYGVAAGQIPDTTFVGADNQLGLAGTLTPGVYRFGGATTANLIGNLTLSGGASDVWVFQATSTLVTAGSSTMTLSGGARSCNVFWQVGTSATLGASSTFVGTILAAADISLGNAADVDGRLLAENAVTLIANTIRRSTCSGSSGGGSPPQEASREIYCTPDGVAYDLVAGQNTLAPYDTLGLVPAYVDPVTGSKSCSFPAVTPSTTPTPTPTTTPTPTPTAEEAAIAAAKVAAAKKLAAAKAAAAKAAAAKKVAGKAVGFARTARVRVALTG